MQPANMSIRSRIALLLAIVALPLLALQTLSGVRAYRSTVHDAEDHVLMVAEATAAAVLEFADAVDAGTASLASTYGTDLLKPDRCRAVVPPAATALRSLANLVVVDSAGRAVCAARGEGGASAAGRSWFESVRRRRGFAAGVPAVGPLTGRWVVALANPLPGEDGRFPGAVAATVDLEAFGTRLATHLTGASDLVTLATSDGTVLTRSTAAGEWVGRRLPTRTVEVDRRGPAQFITRTEDADGTRRIWGRVDLEDLGWRVYAGVPEREVYGAGLANLRLLGGATAVALALVLALALFLFQGTARSLRELVEGVRTAGPGEPIATPTSAPLEVREVVAHFNHALAEADRAREAERAARARANHLVDNAVFGIYVSTLDGRFLQVNRALAAMMGYDHPQELLRAGAASLYPHPEERERLIADARATGVIDNVQTEWVARDGRLVAVRLNGRVVEQPDGDAVFEVIVEDITERKALAELARHQQKMEAVGRLAGGIAHEFNNLLTVLGVNSELLRDSLGDDHPMVREAEEIGLALRRAEGLTRKLLAFSRKDVTQPRLIRPDELVDGLQGMLRRVLPETIHLRTDTRAGDAQVWIDPGSLEQVVLNLVLNARDAIGRRDGTITIETAVTGPPPGEAGAGGGPARDADGPERGWLRLSVRDDGPGIEPALRDLVFEPFFTTKPPGVGTGLGLPTVFSIAAEAGGAVTLDTEVGRGAVFHVWLPLASTGDAPPAS